MVIWSSIYHHIFSTFMYSSTYFLSNDFAYEIEQIIKNLKEIKYDNDFDTYENAIICQTASKEWMTDGVYNENLELLTAYYRWENPPTKTDRVPAQQIDVKTIKTVSETVIYGGLLVGHFGHFITDTFNRLWYVLKYKDSKYKIAFLNFRYDDYDLRPFQNEFFKLLGIEKESILIIEEPTRFDKVIVPKQAVYWNTSYNTGLISLVYDKLISSVTPKKSDKIYISKSKVKESDSFNLNEEYFESFFSSQGFEIIYPEQLPVSDQIAYIAGAKEIACTSGTLSHLVLFAKNDVKLICLSRSNLDIWITYIRRQILINKIRNINCIFIDVSLNFIPLITILNTHLIGPTTYWQDFVQKEYGLDISQDIYEYMDNANIKIGSYIKSFVKNLDRFKFGYVGYYLAMIRTYNSEEYDQTLESLHTHKLFTRNSYKFKKANQDEYCIVRLCPDGTIDTIEGRLFDEISHWVYFKGKLYFLNSSLQAIDEFIIHPVRAGMLLKNKYYVGNSIPNPGETYELIENEHKFLRMVIKLLVSKKVYKKLKQDPVSFFKDSKSSLIKFLGSYYY